MATTNLRNQVLGGQILVTSGAVEIAQLETDKSYMVSWVNGNATVYCKNSANPTVAATTQVGQFAIDAQAFIPYIIRGVSALHMQSDGVDTLVNIVPM